LPFTGTQCYTYQAILFSALIIMKNTAAYILLTALILTGYISCKKPFNANLTSTATGILTVDGPIISGDSTFITLGRTTALNDTTQNKAELKATVSVEDDQAKLYPFTETGKGNYVLGITNFSTTRQYRLDIKTSDGKIYQSDFVLMKVAPPIDSVYFTQTSDATVLFYANTHDPTNNTRYYRWDYKETWEYTSYYGGYMDSIAFISYVYKNGGINKQYSPPLFVGTCYGSDNSNEIIVGSSAKLANDVIIGEQIGGLAGNSIKIAKIYNMQLHEYALTEAGFIYYQNLKTNTEETGSIFDAQPSVTTGNIHCISSPTDRVIGFISVSTRSTNIFSLHYDDLPLRVQLDFSFDCPPGPQGVPCYNYVKYYVGPPDISDCVPINPGFGGAIMIAPAANFSTRLSALFANTLYPIMIDGATYGTDSNGNPVITGYNYIRTACADCRAMEANASLNRPSYFPPF